MSSLLELELRPGVGLGIFELGASLWTVLALLRDNTTLFPHVDVKYDPQQPTISPILLHIRPHLDLLFSPSAQRLATISIRRLHNAAALTLRYALHESGETIVLSSPSVILRRAGVAKVFGPTYPGENALSFPGVWFAFEDDASTPQLSSSPRRKNQPASATQGIDRNAEVKRVVVCQRTKGDNELAEEVEECPPMDGELKNVLIKPRTGVFLTFHNFCSEPPLPPIEIRLGVTTAQDLTCDLGSPLRTFYKEDDRMTIHSPRGLQEPDDSYFFNYFQYGMDILISGSTHTVKKIILHSNVPGSYLFQRYKRCPWEIRGTADGSREPQSATIGDRIDKAQRLLAPSNSADPPSMVLDRAADALNAPTLQAGVTKLLGFDGVVVEITDSGDILTIMMFQ